ncbi:MAG: G/U mismatch-specific DNA glycosylase [Planctomycetes bacterium]|nr:G/U mismatch-specific DNA glycosylase [Planctomycetota bacterium]
MSVRLALKPTKQQLADAYGKKLPDVIAAQLKVLFVGINPSLYSAVVGHHFARPGNRFWPALLESGLTDRLLSPFEDRKLLDYGFGLTNVVDFATARADELAGDAFVQGVRSLKRKIRKLQPRCVALLGITAYRQAYGRKNVEVGEQLEKIGGSTVWVLPNPSGLNAHYQLPDFARLFGQLKKALD